MAMSKVTPLNMGSTQKEPPNCWMPEMPTARMMMPIDRAPDIDAARLDGGGPEEGANKGRQQELKTHAGLSDAQLRRQQHTRQCREKT